MSLGKSLRMKIAKATQKYASLPQRVPFSTAPCAIHKTHEPTPASVELHHIFPLYLQEKVNTTDRDRIPLCGTGHNDVHLDIDAILAGQPKPRGVGRTEHALAEEAVALYKNAGGQV